jgi:hypothetical protein
MKAIELPVHAQNGDMADGAAVVVTGVPAIGIGSSKTVSMSSSTNGWAMGSRSCDLGC